MIILVLDLGQWNIETMRHSINCFFGVPLMDSSNFGKNAKYCLTQTFNSLDLLLQWGMIFNMSKQEGVQKNKKRVEVLVSCFLCKKPVLNEMLLWKFPKGEGTLCS